MGDKNLDLAVVETLNQFDLKPLGTVPVSSKPHIKRPMNAFMVWSRSARKTISHSTQPLPSNQLSKTLGEMWNRLTHEQKLPFIEEAKRLKQEHMKQNPGYKYQPKRKSKKGLKIVTHVESHNFNALKSNGLNFGIESHEKSVKADASSASQCNFWSNQSFQYPNNYSSFYSFNPMYYSQSANDNYCNSNFNPCQDYHYTNPINPNGFNYEANSFNYPYSPYSVNSSYSLDSNASS